MTKIVYEYNDDYVPPFLILRQTEEEVKRMAFEAHLNATREYWSLTDPETERDEQKAIYSALDRFKKMGPKHGPKQLPEIKMYRRFLTDIRRQYSPV